MRILHKAIAAGLVVLSLAACSRDNPRLLNLRSEGNGPDEFAILPTRPLEIPDDLSTLPTPTPGGTNLTDPDPEADVAAALGGNINRAPAGGATLMSYTTRFGVGADIRDVLAAEDLEFRRAHDGLPLERIFSVNTYHRAYRSVALDRYAELARLRAAGIRTPAAPPDPSAQ